MTLRRITRNGSRQQKLFTWLSVIKTLVAMLVALFSIYDWINGVKSGAKSLFVIIIPIALMLIIYKASAQYYKKTFQKHTENRQIGIPVFDGVSIAYGLYNTVTNGWHSKFEILRTENSPLANNAIGMNTLLIIVLTTALLVSVYYYFVVFEKTPLNFFRRALIKNIHRTMSMLLIKTDSVLLRKIGVSSLRSFFELEDSEIDLYTQGLKYSKENNKKEKMVLANYSPIQFRKLANNEKWYDNYEFNISLVRGDRIQYATIISASSKTTSQNGETTDGEKTIAKHAVLMHGSITVDLYSSHLVIVDNSGKKFLKWFDEKNATVIIDEDNRLKAYKSEMHKAAKSVEENPTLQFSKSIHLSPNIFYRWGSAGVLPVIEYRGKRWIALLFRDIEPIGWNLPLGASIDEIEKTRPTTTAVREMMEELVISNSSTKDFNGSREWFHLIERQRMLFEFTQVLTSDGNTGIVWDDYVERQNSLLMNSQKIAFVKPFPPHAGIKASRVRTNSKVIIHNDAHFIDVYYPSRDYIVSIDPRENGIDCVKPYCMKLEEDEWIVMGEIDAGKKFWINNPVMLISIDAIECKRPDIDTHEDNWFCDAVLRDILKDQENYVLFGVELQHRKDFIDKLSNMTNTKGRAEKRIIKDTLSFQKKVYEMFARGVNEEGMIDVGIENPMAKLCPATREIISSAFNIYYGIDLKRNEVFWYGD